MLCNSLQSWVCQEHISNVRTKIPKSESKIQQIIAENIAIWYPHVLLMECDCFQNFQNPFRNKLFTKQNNVKPNSSLLKFIAEKKTFGTYM